MAYRQQTCISISQFWRLEVQDQGTSMVRLWQEPSSRLLTADFSLYPHLEKRDPENSLGFFYEGTNSIHVLYSYDLITSQRSIS